VADEHLRRLEREACAGGVTETANWLQERLRRGDDLNRNQINLAAYLGDGASRLVLSREGIVELAPPRTRRGFTSEETRQIYSRGGSLKARGELADWLAGLWAWRPRGEISFRAGIAVLKSVIEIHPPGVTEYRRDRFRLYRDRLQECFARTSCTGSVDGEERVELDRLLEDAVERISPRLLPCSWLSQPGSALVTGLGCGQLAQAPVPVRAAIERELVPFVLGLRDPIEERVRHVRLTQAPERV